jgi:hypothetical protein
MKKNDLLSELKIDLNTFCKIYATRPIQDNSGGMGFNHSFALWKMLRVLNPDLIVESGIWKGHSTWLIETTLPNAKIISFDTSLELREYFSPAATYSEGDFQFYDWSSENLENSLIFFDDHQNSYSRILLAYFFGFKRLIFEDNYPIDDGDFYSLNHLLSDSGFPDIQLSSKYRKSWRSRFKRIWYLPVLQRVGSHQNWIIPENSFDSKNLKRRTLNMVTFPRILGNDGSVESEFLNLVPEFDLVKSDNKLEFSYNNITYLELQ